jgi:hypothetical protein
LDYGSNAERHHSCPDDAVRARIVSLLAVLASPVWAQLPRLVDTIERPMAYLCLEAAERSAGDGAAARRPGPVQRLLADPSLDAVLGPADGAGLTSGSRALALVRGLLARSSGELELVLTGIVPDGGQPLLVLRARLQPQEADGLQLALDGNDLAEPQRRIGSRQTFRLRSQTPAAAPGQAVELALVGHDLLVGNDMTAVQEVLAPPPAVTSAGGGRAVLSADARFQMLRPRLPVGPGALWIYADWQRLGQRIAAAIDGVPGWLLGSSGLGDTAAVMAAVAGERADYAVTLLMDVVAPPAEPAPRRPHRPGRPAGGPGVAERGDRAFRGWFDAVQPTAARTLLADLPTNGLGGLVLSMDLAQIAARSRDGAHLLHDLHRAFDDYGLDFERHVLARLGARGTVQLQVASGDGAPRVSAVYAMRAKSRKAAADLFTDLRRATEPAGVGTLLVVEPREAGRDRRPVEMVQLRHCSPSGPGATGGRPVVCVAPHEDALWFAAEPETLAAHVEELRRGSRPRGRRGEAAAALAGAAGAESVAGLFDLDLQPLFERLAAAFAGEAVKAEPGLLPRRHAGCIDMQRHGDDTVVRVRVLSSP